MDRLALRIYDFYFELLIRFGLNAIPDFSRFSWTGTTENPVARIGGCGLCLIGLYGTRFQKLNRGLGGVTELLQWRDIVDDKKASPMRP